MLALLFSDDCLNSIFRSKVYLLPSLEDIDLREKSCTKGLRKKIGKFAACNTVIRAEGV